MKCYQTTTTLLALAFFAGLTTAPAQIFNSLEWRSVIGTTDISFNAIQAEFGSGGLYEGWRHATLGETLALTETFGYNPAATPEQNAPAVEDLHGFFGVTNASSAFQFNAWTLGFVAEGTRLDIRITIPDFGNPALNQGSIYQTAYPVELAAPEVGHYLVRSVPEPAHAALALAMAALLLAHRRRR
jgi:MYXO-CTERM domain-containing protein